MGNSRSRAPAVLGDGQTRCSPVAGVALTVEQAKRFAKLLKVIAEPSRLRVVSTIASRQKTGAWACELTDALGLSQPTVSHHMGILVRAGILEPVSADPATPSRPGPRCTYYRLVPKGLSAVARALTPTPV